MKDDLAELRNVASVEKVGVSTSSKSLVAPQEKSARKNIFIVLTTFLGILFVGVGGVFFYQTWGQQAQEPVVPEPLQDISYVIPKDVMAVAVYNVDSEANRSVIQDVWNTKDGGEAGKQVSYGDPRQILSISDIDRAYYFIMAGDTSPYIAIKKTEATTEFVSKQSNVNKTERGGWYILHDVSMDEYNSAIENASSAGSVFASAIAQGDSPLRYIINPAYAGKILATPLSLPIKNDPVVLNIENSSNNGVLHAQYFRSRDPVVAKVIPDVTQLQSLIPSDAQLIKIGESFVSDITAWQKESHALDGAIFDQPTVQQFIAKFDAPYAFFQRIGSDGVADMGLIVQLPAQLKGTLGHSDSVVETLMYSFASFITGRALESGISFSDSSYQLAPIRYVNLQGQTQTLDYMIGDSFILMASSREGMNALVDTALGQDSGIVVTGPWNELVASAGTSLTASTALVGSVKDAGILSLLPVASSLTTVPVIVSTRSDNAGIAIDATLLLSK